MLGSAHQKKIRTSNIQHPTSNAERRTKERSGDTSSRGARARSTSGSTELAEVSAEPARPCANTGASAMVRSILLFGSTLDVRRSMFDVRVSRGPRAGLLPIHPATRTLLPTHPRDPRVSHFFTFKEGQKIHNSFIIRAFRAFRAIRGFYFPFQVETGMAMACFPTSPAPSARP